jgi:hypothetical protein
MIVNYVQFTEIEKESKLNRWDFDQCDLTEIEITSIFPFPFLVNYLFGF